MANGYLIVKQAFSREKAAEFTRDMWVRLGIDPNDKETWPRDRERIHMPAHIHEPVATFAPRVGAFLYVRRVREANCLPSRRSGAS